MKNDISAEDRIKDSFLELLSEKPFGKITVTEIVRRSGVNRTTFYRKYQNTQELYDEVRGDLERKILDREISGDDPKEALHAYGAAVFRSLEDNADMLSVLGGINSDLTFCARFAETFARRLEAYARERGVTDVTVLRNIDFSAGFTKLYCFTLIEQLFELIAERYALTEKVFTLEEYDYDMTSSLFENVSECLRRQRGGSFDLQYNLVMSEVKLFHGFRNASRGNVTELLRTAGTPDDAAHYRQLMYYLGNVGIGILTYFTGGMDENALLEKLLALEPLRTSAGLAPAK